MPGALEVFFKSSKLLKPYFLPSQINEILTKSLELAAVRCRLKKLIYIPGCLPGRAQAFRWICSPSSASVGRARRRTGQVSWSSWQLLSKISGISYKLLPLLDWLKEILVSRLELEGLRGAPWFLTFHSSSFCSTVGQWNTLWGCRALLVWLLVQLLFITASI